ncbi:MAG: hypothetical protein KJ947_07440 [Alphaproteobacteria bacterium]|mgnify:CR=1 FL=1|jgi:acyl carrier protein|nr:hypothetical protein [Alphaproteobacteria bacterium]MBU1549395.1 hypothetical protein [Alphaproteobacteria bacterium]MBU2338160.1 hypothetical protein [Alphaproteobacteria bacterium]MBU2387547.1 hypothetical protein [Alphaproteobacteria bacterium]|tara:strand:- start:434 stop:685 length:252 start_codon:yes stop_codon:yes gene_type:complete
MSERVGPGIRGTIMSILNERGIASVGETEGLFSSGLLDSMAATEVLIALESGYGVDLSDEDFDILQIDTLESIEVFLSARNQA